jgi:hypothetical protein
VFKEVGGTSKSEEVEINKEPGKVFNLRNEEHDSKELTELNEEVEYMNLVVRRSE